MDIGINKGEKNMTSKQRAYLRSLSNQIDPIFQIGKLGISDNLIKQIKDALKARELIKIKVLETVEAPIKDIAEEISLQTDSIIVQIMGNKITLYRARKKDSKIVLPE